ncbi:MAG: PKD domain-containing protein [Gammaproteobacteria bacterium]
MRSLVFRIWFTRNASGQARFYINGIQESSATVSGNFSNWGDFALALANEPSADKQGKERPWLGEMYLVAMYDRALSAAEVDTNFWAGPVLDPDQTWEPPTADFSVNLTSGTLPLVVNFTNASLGDIDSYSWDFGDGSTSAAEAPNHTYNAAGNYTVSLTVTGPGGSDSKIIDGLITVLPQPSPPPEADFSATPINGTAPLMVNFTDTSTGSITDWSWDFGDGSSGSGQNAIKSYTKPGTYTVRLNITGPNGNDSISKTNLITVQAAPPVADFTINSASTTGVAPFSVNFTDTSSGEVTSRTWNFGDGSTSTAKNPSHTYDAAGSYTVSLSVTGPGGTDAETKTSYITVVDEYTDSRITAGQIALYTFEEGAGGTVKDVSGAGVPLDLVISNPASVNWLPGGGIAITKAATIRSSGAASRLRTALQASQAITIEAWVTPANTTQAGPARIVALSQDGLNGGNFAMGQDGTKYMTRLRTSTTDKYGKPALSTSTGTAVTGLSHLVYTRNASGQARFYINGIQESSATVSGNFSNWGDFALALANEPSADKQGKERPWLGEMYLVAMYDRALSAAEVDTNFWAGPEADLPLSPSSALLETGEIAIDHIWQRVNLTKSFEDPVVIANAPSLDSGQPVVVRIRNVDASGFDIRLQEWDYLDGAHGTETVGYLAMERGNHTLPDGTQVEAGSIEIGNVHTSFKTVSLQQSFSTAPVIMAAVASINESDAVTTRLRNIGTSGFQVQLQEQEANARSHAVEAVNYIAWEPSIGTIDDISFEVGRTPDAVTHKPYYIDFQSTFLNAPIFLADMQSRDGGDTASIRSDSKDMYGVDVIVAEEQSKNSEVGHTSEVVGYMVFSKTD